MPGGVFSDLLEQGYIGDVLYGRNDTELRWMGAIDFLYSKTITSLVQKIIRNKVLTMFIC